MAEVVIKGPTEHAEGILKLISRRIIRTSKVNGPYL